MNFFWRRLKVGLWIPVWGITVMIPLLVLMLPILVFALTEQGCKFMMWVFEQPIRLIKVYNQMMHRKLGLYED